MKRLTAIFLALVLALSALPALAAQEVNLPEKFFFQVRDSGYNGEITFSVEGQETKAIDAVTWSLLKSLAPRLKVVSGSSCIQSTGVGQGHLQLMLDGQEAGNALFLYNKALGGLSTTLLGSGDIFYTAPRDWSFAPLYAGLMTGDSAWPSLWGVLLKINQAPAEWQEKAAPYLLPYETKVGVWINGYATFSAGMDQGTAYSQLQCLIPVQAVKAQLKQLLVDFYEDEGLLSLLREVLSAEEAAAYLQPTMMNAFFSMIDQLDMDGMVEIYRRYNTMGVTLLDSIILPFPENAPLSSLSISLTPDEAGKKWQIAGRLQDGTDFDVSCIAGEEMIYTGSVSLVLPAQQQAGNSFVVEEDDLLPRAIAFDYNFSWEDGEESFSLLTGRYTRVIQGTLLLRPQAGSDMPIQVLTLTAQYESAADQRRATQLIASLTWRDMDSDAAITASFTGRTAAPGMIQSLDTVGNTLRLDQMDEAGMASLVQMWTAQLQNWLATFTMRLFPAFTVEDQPLG